MTQTQFLTIGELAELLKQPVQRTRRAVDSLPLPVDRQRGYRLVPVAMVPLVRAELARRDAVCAKRGTVR